MDELEKQRTEDWEEYVRSEINAMLDVFLPNCAEGAVVIKYKKAILEETEAGPVFKEDSAVGVEIILDFNFLHEAPIPTET